MVALSEGLGTGGVAALCKVRGKTYIHSRVWEGSSLNFSSSHFLFGFKPMQDAEMYFLQCLQNDLV